MVIKSNTVNITVTPPVGTACPATLAGFLVSDPSKAVTANLVSAQQAEQLNGASSFVGLLATYQIQGGYTVGEVVIPSFGGLSADTFGLLSGYHYCYDGSCHSTNNCPAPPTAQTFVIAAITSSGTCDIPYTGTQTAACTFAQGMVGKYEDSFSGGCFHELVTSVQVWLGAQRVC